MTDILLDVGTYLLAQGVAAEEALFYENMKDTPDAAICLYEYSGDGGLPQVDMIIRSVQLVARDTSVKASKAKAEALFRSLRTDDGIVELTTSRVVSVLIRQTPFKLKVDAQGRAYYAFNIGIMTNLD